MFPETAPQPPAESAGTTVQPHQEGITESASTDHLPSPPTPPTGPASQSDEQVEGERTSADGEQVVIPKNAMKKVREQARLQGRKKMQAELDETARGLGYKSHEDMVAKIRQQQGQRRSRDSRRPKQQQQQPRRTQAVDPKNDAGQQPESPRQITRLQNQLAQGIEERKRINRQRANEERRRKDAERLLEAERAEGKLRVAAVRAGVHEVDFAIHLLRKEISGKDATELEGFDEDKFFREELRKRAPYLYEVETRPADTSTQEDVTEGKGEPKPGPRGAAPANGENGPVDVRKLSQEEYQEYLRKRGLLTGQFGMPS